MTVRIGTYLIEQVSRGGRIRLYGNSWFDNPDNLNLQAGHAYKLKIDDTKRVILAEIAVDGLTQAVEIDLLTADNTRLRAILDVLGVDPDYPADVLLRDDLDSERDLDQFYLAQAQAECEAETRGLSWIDMTTEPLVVRRLYCLIENGQDRVKSTGADVRRRISEYCETVPIAMLPYDIREHIRGQVTTDDRY